MASTAAMCVLLGMLSPQSSRRQILATSLALGAAPAIPVTFRAELPASVFDQIRAGRPVVLPGWLPPADVTQLSADARALHSAGHFTSDGLAAYAPTRSASRAAGEAPRSREVLPAYIPSAKRAGPWADATIGDAAARLRFASRIDALRLALAESLGRSALDAPAAREGVAPPTPAAPRSLAALASKLSEISYTRFGPGASLRRHVDEHHEALKGPRGWDPARPTRRSVSWLVYLNNGEWDPAVNGGALRTFPRRLPPASPVGADRGELQVGWLRASPADPVERPVFLDSSGARGGSGECALFTVEGRGGGERVVLSRAFGANPILYQSSSFLVDRLVIDSPRAAGRFQFVEAPRSAAAEWLAGVNGADAGEAVLDVPPNGGTLVLFDSVALPHEVLPTVGRERWACSGWLHEPQLQRRAA